MYKTWDAFMLESSNALLHAELSFVSMDSGVAYYRGEFKGEIIHCHARESCTSNFHYDAIEQVVGVTQGERVVLKVGERVILNTH